MVRHVFGISQFTCLLHYTLHTAKLLGGILVSLRSSVRLSVRPASRVRSVAPTVLVGSTPYLYILWSNFKKCVRVSCKISKFEFLAIFLNLKLWLCLVLTWDLMWIISMGNHGAVGGISERRHSSCSSYCQGSNLEKYGFTNCNMTAWVFGGKLHWLSVPVGRTHKHQ